MSILSTKAIDFEAIYQEDFFQQLSTELQLEVRHEVHSIEALEMWYDSNGRKVKGFIVSPKDTTKTYPVLLYARGGSKEHGMITRRVITFVLARMASWGYVVIATQYSGNDGSEGKDEYSGMDLDDVDNLKQVAEELSYADTSTISAWGGSRGGLMVCNLWRRVAWLKNVILECPSLDLIDNYQRRPELKDFRADMYDVTDESLNRAKSPIYHINELHTDTKVMIIQGGQDIHVNPEKTLEFFGLLQEAGIDVDLHYFAEADHTMGGIVPQLWRLRREFLRGE